ncbi:MAG: DUF983 domain-containing protein [Flavobacterium lindanitolerans]|jgi:uncharacterized protein (DUF983 family)|uniref:DUF983 domain-containing protein n=1 Tax=Flavobacterium TaxID=237 RepID=UPI0006F86ACE|nr:MULTISPECIES: DUF983 domain-containing protein [Flavobacterium]KQS47775.1 hypothetical protein ASG38_10070 [Flavobacterium sp. Leaf359]MBL7868646.1 DUF983 domain-containing protein [Flavobacterium lindanitolerans]MBU7570335.1 DUF983 domain-containing protein [Flavobacterium sp.]PZO28802.1 MAG: DUF983 domain-containing protein [Flavobacteriaceae bacterium]
MSFLKNVIQNKCPHCGKGKVFKTNGNPFLFQMPEMHPECSECGHKFVKEPGFFFGAMYVSYALAVGEMVATFFISRLFVTSLVHSLLFIVAAAFLLCTINFRYSRLLWIYMFDSKAKAKVN